MVLLRTVLSASIAVLVRLAAVLFFSAGCILFLHPSPARSAGPPKIETGLGRLPSSDLPVDLSADRLDHREEDDVYVADGNVHIAQGTLRLSCDRAEYHAGTGALEALGHVVMTDGENTVNGDSLNIDLNNRVGVIANGRLFIRKDNYTLEGTVLERVGEDRYRIQEGTFTACETDGCRHPDWMFRAARMDVQLDRYLTARNVFFYVRGIPVAYVPYIVFPVKRSRQSGFLIPRFGYSSQGGARFNDAFYWVIADNQDATFRLDYRGSKGTGGGLEYRYRLSRQSYGQFEANIFHDLETESNRIDGTFKHVQEIHDRLDWRADLHYVNDRNLYRDLSEVITESVQASIESNLFATRRWDSTDVTLLARYTQDLTTRNVQTLQRLPELRAAAMDWNPWDLPLHVGFQGSATNFYREQGIRLQRVDLFPSAKGSVSGDGWSLVPQAGFRETAYTKDADGSGTAHRETAYLAAIGRAVFSRVYSPEGWGNVEKIKHVIEPEVTYEYVPGADQSDLPAMDEIDRISGKNLVNVRLMNRFFARTHGEEGKSQPVEMLDLRVTQGIDLHELRRDLPSGSSREPLTALRAELSIRPVEELELLSDAFYNWHDHSLRAINTDASVKVTGWLTFYAGHYLAMGGEQPQRGDLFSPISLQDVQIIPQSINFVTGRAEVHLGKRIAAGAAFFYDYKDSKIGETNYGIKYVAQCWSLALGYRVRPNQHQFSFLFNLSGSDTVSASTFGDLFKPTTGSLF